MKSRRVLEYRSPILKFPTTGAIVGNMLYFIANADFDNLSVGKIAATSRLEPVKIAVMPLNCGFHQASTPYERGGTA